jgi:hypothetical protein
MFGHKKARKTLEQAIGPQVDGRNVKDLTMAELAEKVYTKIRGFKRQTEGCETEKTEAKQKLEEGLGTPPHKGLTIPHLAELARKQLTSLDNKIKEALKERSAVCSILAEASGEPMRPDSTLRGLANAAQRRIQRLKEAKERIREQNGESDKDEAIDNTREILRQANGDLINHQKSLEELASSVSQKLRGKERLSKENESLSKNVHSLQESLDEKKEENERLRNIIDHLIELAPEDIDVHRGENGEPVEVSIGRLSPNMNAIEEMGENAEKVREQVRQQVRKGVHEVLERLGKEDNEKEDEPIKPAKSHDHGIYIGRAKVRSVKLEKEGQIVRFENQPGGGYVLKERKPGHFAGSPTITPECAMLWIATYIKEDGYKAKGADLKDGMEEPYFQNAPMGEFYERIEDAFVKALDKHQGKA